MENKKKINEYLSKICLHPYFEKSPRNKRLLKYLVKQAILQNDVKEQTIGLELFNDNYNPQNNDGKVRVYMFNLRKKLSEYYEDYGCQDELIFKIDKGQYNLSFEFPEKKKKEKRKIFNKKDTKKIVSLLLISTIVFFTLKLFVFPKELYCWTNFFNNDNQNMLLIADHYMVQQKQSDGSFRTVQIFGVNNDKDLYNYLKKHPDQKLRPGGFYLMSSMATTNTKKLTDWFHLHNTDFSMKFDSEFRFSDSHKNNIVYIGQAKTMHDTKEIFLKNSKLFSIYGDGFKLKEDGTEKLYKATASKGHLKLSEYAIVSYQKLKTGKNILFFVSNHDIGSISVVKKFTDTKWLANFYKKNNLKKNSHFNALFKVSGLRRTEMDNKLIKLEITD